MNLKYWVDTIAAELTANTPAIVASLASIFNEQCSKTVQPSTMLDYTANTVREITPERLSQVVSTESVMIGLYLWT